jgi:hypothetical protein
MPGGEIAVVRRTARRDRRMEIIMRRQRTGLGALVAVPLLLAVLAGCGSSTDGDSGVATAGGGSAQPTASPSTSPAADEEERRLQFTRCLREQGLDVPDAVAGGQPGGGAAAVRSADPKKFDDAVNACRQYAGGSSGRQGLSEQDKQRMLEFTRCLRQQGVDIGDPDPATGIPPIADVGRLVNDPKFTEAQKACAQYAPQRLGGGNR